MNFHDYLESEYVRTNIALQQVYSPYGQGKIQATQGLIHFQKRVLTWINYSILLFQYSLIRLHLKPTPPTAQELVKVLTEKTAQVKAEAKPLDLERQALVEEHLKAQKANSENVVPLEGHS